MTAHDILKELIRIRPDFRNHWDGENYFRGDDGSFTACGAYSQFTDFFRECHLQFKKEELEDVASLVVRCESDDFLRDSAYTCFLENIAGDPSEDTLAPYLSPSAIEFINHWKSKK